MLKCPNCSAKINGNRHYCPKCGTALTQQFDVSANPPDKTKPRRILLIICCSLLAAVLIFAALFTRNGKFTDTETLTQEYLALLSANKPEQMEKLFLPEIMDVVELSQIDGCYTAYGTAFEQLGIYDVTDKSPFNANLIQRLLRNNYGIDTPYDSYCRQLVGVLVDGTDVWFNIDMVRLGQYWYIVQVTA